MPSRRPDAAVGFTLPDTIADTLATVPQSDWRIAYDADGEPWVLEVTGLFDLSRWPTGMRVIVCKERPHPGRSCGCSTATGTG